MTLLCCVCFTEANTRTALGSGDRERPVSMTYEEEHVGFSRGLCRASGKAQPCVGSEASG